MSMFRLQTESLLVCLLLLPSLISCARVSTTTPADTAAELSPREEPAAVPPLRREVLHAEIGLVVAMSFAPDGTLYYAFAQDNDDARLVRQLKRGSELRVEATSSRNTRVTYHFSLKGSSAAIDRAASTCR